MVADFSDDDWMTAVLTFDKARSALVLRIRAKRTVRITELQGFMSDVEAFGLTMPEGFRRMQFGEGAAIPEEMKSDMEHMNRLNFRWGWDRSLKAGAELELAIPASGAGKEMAVLTIGYEFPRMLGLLKGKQGLYARLSK